LSLISFHGIFFRKSLHEIRELGKSVGLGVEIRLCPLDILARGAYVPISVVLLVFVPGDPEKFVDLFYVFFLWILRRNLGNLHFFLLVIFHVFRRTANLCILIQVLQEHGFIAGVAESYPSSFLTYSHNVVS